MSMHKKLALIFGTPIAIALVLVTIYYSQIQEKLAPIVTPAAPSEEILIGEWKTYQHPTEGFLIDYPPDNKFTTTENVAYLAGYDADYGYYPNMNIDIEEGQYDNLDPIDPLGNLISLEKELITINGIPGIKYKAIYLVQPEGNVPHDPIELGCEAYRLGYKNKVYHFRLHACEGFEEFEKVVESFRFPE